MALPATAQGEGARVLLDKSALAQAPADVRGFYARRADRPMWIAADGSITPAAQALLKLVQTARLDGISPRSLNAEQLAAALDRAQAEHSPAAITQAEVELSSTLVAYEKALLQNSDGGMDYEHPNLRPYAPGPQTIVAQAGASKSLEQCVTGMQWMHPLYAQLREALMAEPESGAMRDEVSKNLERLRAIPRSPSSRYILVDAAGSRLYMYEGDHVVDTMKVVVGKPEMPTPMYAGYVRYATFNPYWYVPEDLVPHKIAPNVISMGMSYLKRQGYQVVSDYTPDAEVIDPSTIDWHAVAKGTLKVKLRQNPGGANAMGKVKYEFPNKYGIYLHDTPERDLLKADAPHFSSGCIRLEDAHRLGQWLLGYTPSVSSQAEQRVDLAQPVPVYVTYITAHTNDVGQIALGPDPYGRDGHSGTALASAD
jgi:murein L,D-transpeptidase YcbB/YkuD